MSAHLDAVGLRANVIGVMDHPVGEPQEALFDCFQMIHEVPRIWCSADSNQTVGKIFGYITRKYAYVGYNYLYDEEI